MIQFALSCEIFLDRLKQGFIISLKLALVEGEQIERIRRI